MVALVAATAATMFQRPAERDAAADLAASTNYVASPGRGQIVPLVVAEDALPTAFVASESTSARAAVESLSKLRSLPTIRASVASESIAPPQLAHDFPRPLPLASAAAEASNAANAEIAQPKPEEFAPIALPTIAAKPVVAQPVQHVIVDGDTLPQLAERYLGDASLAEEIFAQNRDQLASPELLPLGVTLVISRSK